MKVIKYLSLTVFFILSSVFVQAGELNGVRMDDEVQVGEKKLVLNGMGLRKVTRFGIPVKVYVAGLYLENKSVDSDEIIKSPQVKRLIMEMLYNVDRDAMADAFEKSFTENCVADCENKRKQFAQFKTQIVSVRKKDRLIFTYYPDRVEYEVVGANARKITLDGADLSQNLLALFINKKQPPTPEFRAGLLSAK